MSFSAGQPRYREAYTTCLLSVYSGRECLGTYGLCEAHHLRIADALKTVDLIAWDNLHQGRGHRGRRRGDYLLALQNTPLLAKVTWRDRGITCRWPEKIDLKIYPCEFYPHAKPFERIKRLTNALTHPGDLVVDPAAGSFVALRAARELGREFIGCDITFGRARESDVECETIRYTPLREENAIA